MLNIRIKVNSIFGHIAYGVREMIIQIYEIQTPKEAETLIDLGVNHIGSVLLSENGWKDKNIKKTISLVQKTTAKSSLIPLFSTPESIFRALDYYAPDIVHFCESITDEKGISRKAENLVVLQNKIKEKFPEILIMRSIPIACSKMADKIDSLKLAKMFEPVSDFFLTDTFIFTEKNKSTSENQPVSGFVGITGTTCDWNLAADLVRLSSIPVILAGGLDPYNVYDAIIKTRPAGVDSCTGTNKSDSFGKPVRFQKDIEKVRLFVNQAEKAESDLKESAK